MYQTWSAPSECWHNTRIRNTAVQPTSSLARMIARAIACPICAPNMRTKICAPKKCAANIQSTHRGVRVCTHTARAHHPAGKFRRSGPLSVVGAPCKQYYVIGYTRIRNCWLRMTARLQTKLTVLTGERRIHLDAPKSTKVLYMVFTTTS